MSFSSWLQSIWYRPRPAPIFLRMWVPLYRLLNRFDRWRQIRQQAHPGIPVIVVGNITVGGTGKTPFVIWLTEFLKRKGFKPGIVSRGYGAEDSSSSPLLITESSTAAEAGDEPVMMYQRLRVPICVGQNRQRCADVLKRESDIDIIISDDGLQHLRLARDMQICLIDGHRGFGNGSMLPAGPLRRPVDDLDQMDLIVCSHQFPDSLTSHSHRPMHVMTYQMNVARQLSAPFHEQLIAEFGQDPDRTVHALAGIGNPKQFFDMLEHHGVEHKQLAFTDHHAYQESELSYLKECCLLMTEKDAIKCQAFSGSDWWSVPIDACLPEVFESKLDDLLAASIGTAGSDLVS